MPVILTRNAWITVVIAQLLSPTINGLLQRSKSRTSLRKGCSLGQLLCVHGGVHAERRTTGNTSDKRILQFGDECAAESEVNCKLPSGDDSCDGDCGSCPCEFDASGELSAPYMRTMFSQIAPWCNAQAPSTALLIGLGGGELPQYMLHRCPNMTIEAIELNQDVIDVARLYFGLAESEKLFADRLIVQHTDAITAATQKEDNSYDMVLVDCFAGGGMVPESCRSREFADGVVNLLRTSGVMLQNIWHFSPEQPEVAQQFLAAKQTYSAAFGAPVEDIEVPMPEEIRWVNILKAVKSG